MGCGAAAGRRDREENEAASSSSLKQYYHNVTEIMEGEMQNKLDDPMSVLMRSDSENTKYKAKLAMRYEAVLTPLIEKSFDNHHTLHINSFLDKEQTSVFLKHLASAHRDFLLAFSSFVATRAAHCKVRQHQEMQRAGFAEDGPLVYALMNGAGYVNEAVVNSRGLTATESLDLQDKGTEWIMENIREVSDVLMEEYLEDKAARDAAAFAVLDRNKDGQLQKGEVVDVLKNPDGPKFKRLLAALGLDEQTYADKFQLRRPGRMSHAPLSRRSIA